MKKFLSMLLAVAMVATLAIGVSAINDAGLYTYDESDGEYWSPALAMYDKTTQGIWFEDGTVAGHNIAQLADGTFLEENALANLKSGWYEVVLCNLGTKPEWFPAEVEGKLALTVRGDSTFTVKSENALNAGAIGMLLGNNCRAVELVDETGVMTGEYENITMNLDYATLPMGSVSSDVTARLVAACADIPIADAVVAVENVFFGDLELSVSHKQGAWVFLGTEAEYKANTTRTDANTITGAGAAAAAPAAAATEAAPAADEGGLQNLCAGATIYEISGLETEGSNTGEMAIDGDLTTRWSSNVSDDAHIIIDIGQPLPIGYVEIHWETACAQDYTIETSSDAASWDVRATVTGNTKGTSPASDDCIVVHEWEPATARYIKINCTKRNTEWGNSIWEVVARKGADTVASTAPAAYPGSGAEVPADSVLINGERIGLEEGWGGNAAAGCAAAYDGDINTYFDPLAVGDGWAGIDAGEEMILTKIIIHPRDANLPRFEGATIEGANEEDFSDAVALYFSVEAADEFAYIDVSDEIEEADNTGYRYFRYINYTQHGDVAEVELYGKAVDGSNPTYGAAATEAPAAATEAPAAEAAPADGEEIEFAHYVASANDPYFAYDNTIDIDPEVVTWAQIKYRTITEKDSLDNTLTGQIYVSPAAEPFIPVKWNHTGNWETIVVDLTSVSEKTTLTSLWKDSLGLGFRLDPMESNRDAEANTVDDPAAVLPDSAIDVAYVAFFETEDAAKAFDGVNGAVALIDASMLASPSAATNGTVELLSEVIAAPVVEEAPAVEEAPVVEETPAVEEAPAEEPAVEEVVEAPAEEVVEAPAEEAAEETVEEAPETFDFGVIAVVAAIVSAAGYALSKKR